MLEQCNTQSAHTHIHTPERLDMSIDWDSFTPWSSMSGGLLIGLAVALFVLLNGRILGLSGILGGLLPPRAGDASWRLAFLLGLLAAPLSYAQISFLGAMPAARIEADYPLLILAGLLVGFGTRYGSGCTSGHGICGLSRLSLRSLVATLCFMGAGFATVFVLRHLLP